MKNKIVINIFILVMILLYSGCGKRLSVKERLSNNPSERMQLRETRKNFDMIRYIKNPTLEVQLRAVRNDPFTIRLINNPSILIQKKAIYKNVQVLKYIKNPSEDVQLFAVDRKSYALKYIKNPTIKVQLFAARMYDTALEYISNPSKEVQFAAINKFGYPIRYIKNPSEEMKLKAVMTKGYSIKYIKNPSDELINEAIKNDPHSVKVIKNISQKHILLAIGNKKKLPKAMRKIITIDTLIKSNLDIYLGTRPSKFLIYDKYISIKVSSEMNIEITNKTNNFISINSFSEYFGNDIYSLKSFTIPPNGTVTKNVKELKEFKIKSRKLKFKYGFAIQYQLPNNTKVFSLYKIKKLNIKDLAISYYYE